MNEKSIIIVVGLGYGDESKGATVDYLARRYGIKKIVFYNGGYQRGHNVVTPEGIMFCFSQFGSATFVPGVKTFISSFSLVNPISLMVEGRVLKEKGADDVFDRIAVDRRCLIGTPFNAIINKMQETSRGQNRHGSCGKGIGETVRDLEVYGQNCIFVEDLQKKEALKNKLHFFWHLKIDLAEQIVGQYPGNPAVNNYLLELKNIDLNKVYDFYQTFTKKVRIIDESELLEEVNGGGVIFEGAQGALLDVNFGFWPHLTSTNITLANAQKIIKRSDYAGEVKKIGILRAYHTRHGNGPFVTEVDGLEKIIPGNIHMDEWQGKLRLGWFDLIAAKYALKVTRGVDEIFLTNLDGLDEMKEIKICDSYRLNADISESSGRHFEFLNDKSQIVVGIKPVKNNQKNPSRELTDLLLNCSPEYQIMKGWHSKSDKKLDSRMKSYIKYIQDNLNVRISTISTGPTAADRINLALD